MMDAFIDLCSQLFPCISPYTVENVKQALDQFQKNGDEPNFVSSFFSGESIYQGDCFTNIPYTYFASDGKFLSCINHVMVLSNTCDIANDDFIVFAPAFSISDLELDQSKLFDTKRNVIFNYMYVPSAVLSDYIFDFSHTFHMSKQLFYTLLHSQKTERFARLTDYGFALLIIKMTMCFLRPESPEVSRILK